MTPDERKIKLDSVASVLFAAMKDLDDLIPHLPLVMDQQAARAIVDDLVWATENCTVMGLHQIGEALDDNMGVTS
ncbi:MAG: hypothetical protein ABI947_07715 [Chloroflexota bacterium]